jgi:hypothetical protein
MVQCVAVEPPVYRVLPEHLLSNSYDFVVRPTVLAGRTMAGVVTRHAIPKTCCPLFLGAFAGHLRTEAEIEQKIRGYMARHKVERAAATACAVAYNLTLAHYQPGFDLDPTDEDGRLLPDFQGCIVNFVNEAPPGRPIKVTFVFNTPRQRYELWLMHGARSGEELFTYYGPLYERGYPINWRAASRIQPGIIPAESVLLIEERGTSPLVKEEFDVT